MSRGRFRVDVCRAKKLTHRRASTKDIGVQLTPPVLLSLEQALDFLADDEPTPMPNLAKDAENSVRLARRGPTELSSLR